ncbi:hypothetical protein MAR_020925 [Mya arenaria]|uniref:Uncharacterized protein n=1 Tax=Mya arenaria TaxID=6604 RepID=A0ABY7E9G3_MYAAR|nr:hypothetical protein MAR_020925 [Mya arenaria]
MIRDYLTAISNPVNAVDIITNSESFINMNRLVVTATILTALIGVSVCHLAVMSVDLGSEYMKIAIVKGFSKKNSHYSMFKEW